jgi:hypothetical protein
MKTFQRVLVISASLFATSLSLKASDTLSSASIMNLPLHGSAVAAGSAPRALTIPAANLKDYFRRGTRTDKVRSVRDQLFVAAMGAIVIAGALFGRCRTSPE